MEHYLIESPYMVEDCDRAVKEIHAAGYLHCFELLALIEWWLENKLSPAPAHMGKIYKALIIDATASAVSSR